MQHPADARSVLACQADGRTWEGPCWIAGFDAPLSKLPCFERVTPPAASTRNGAWHEE